jgi:hypothetical protein
LFISLFIHLFFVLLESFLPVREEFHPRRNQARQKLATLPNSRFKDLASDVYHEIRRRYPFVVDDDVNQNTPNIKNIPY